MKQIRQGKLKSTDYLKEIGVPDAKELLIFYEDYFAGRYSSIGGQRPKSIEMMGHKLFVIKYD